VSYVKRATYIHIVNLNCFLVFYECLFRLGVNVCVTSWLMGVTFDWVRYYACRANSASIFYHMVCELNISLLRYTSDALPNSLIDSNESLK
jgi:hypothetical protein